MAKLFFSLGWMWTLALAGCGQAVEETELVSAINGQMERYQSAVDGQFFGCALTVGGKVDCFGKLNSCKIDDAKPLPEPLFLNRYLELSAGIFHACAIDRNHALACGGDDGVGGATKGPEGKYQSVAAGGYCNDSRYFGFGCAVSLEGNIKCWGDNVIDASWPKESGYDKVCAGDTFACALKNDGHVNCWGVKDSFWAPQLQPITQSDFVDISCGPFYAIGRHKDNTVSYLIGKSESPDPVATQFWQLSQGNCGFKVRPSDKPDPGCDMGCFKNAGWDCEASNGASAVILHGPLVNPAICTISARGDFSCVNNTPPWNSAVAPLARWKSIAMGGTESNTIICGIRVSDGSIQCAGMNGPPGGAPFTDVAAGKSHACGTNNRGELLCWGQNQSGPGKAEDAYYNKVVTTRTFTCGLTASGNINCFRQGVARFSPTPLATGDWYKQIRATGDYLCAINQNNQLHCWFADLKTPFAILGPDPASFSDISINPNFICCLQNTGAVSCVRSQDQKNLPIAEFPGELYGGMASGSSHVCALRLDGNARCWNPNANTSELISGNFRAIAAAHNVTCTVSVDDEVSCKTNQGQPFSFPARPSSF